MDRRTFSLVAAALLLPLLIRFAWFFPGYALPRTVATPDYANLKMPQPPISTAVAVPVKSAAGVVVIDYNHGNQFTLSEIQPLIGALTQRGAHVVLYSDTDDLASRLKSASAFVVISPHTRIVPVVVAVSQATREFGSCFRHSSSIASEI